MQEKLHIILLWIKSHLDFLVLGIFTIFLIYIGYRVYVEYNSPTRQPDPLMPWNPPSLLPNENFDKLKKLLETNSTLEEDERFISLGKFNIFDYKIVRDLDTIRKELNNKFEQAKKYYNAGDLKNAKKILVEILSAWPIHKPSQELLEKINAQLQPPPTPTPTPVPAPAPGRPLPPGEVPPEFR